MKKHTFKFEKEKAREQVWEFINQLHSEKTKPSENERCSLVGKLIESYFKATGEYPNEKALKRMGDYLIVDLLSDQYKHHKGNYILTESQIKNRYKRHREVSYDDNRRV